MGYDDWYETEYRQPAELAAVTIDESDSSWETANDEFDTPWEAFDDEIDSWARHALAANGFGDY
jgi:hypothetical protein